MRMARPIPGRWSIPPRSTTTALSGSAALIDYLKAARGPFVAQPLAGAPASALRGAGAL